jgi:hypothetical protein
MLRARPQTASPVHTGSPDIVCADQTASDRIFLVKRTCEFSDVPHLSPFAKLPETLCRKPYFHIYHIIPHIKKIVKALAHKNLDYLYDHFGKRIVKSYKRAESRETDGNLKKFIPISRENEYPKL